MYNSYESYNPYNNMMYQNNDNIHYVSNDDVVLDNFSGTGTISLYLRSVKKPEDKYEEVLECTKSKCSGVASNMAYLFNLTYNNELVIKYEEEGKILEIIRKDFVIDGRVMPSPDPEDPPVELPVIVQDGNNQIITDGQIILVNKFNNNDYNVNVDAILDVVLGPERELFVTITGITKTGTGECINDGNLS